MLRLRASSKADVPHRFIGAAIFARTERTAAQKGDRHLIYEPKNQMQTIDSRFCVRYNNNEFNIGKENNNA